MQEKRILNSVLTIGTGLPENFNLYCFCKKQFYDLCAFNNKINKKVVINVKLENFYGEDEPRDRFLPWVIEKLKKDEDVELTEGYQHRDFIYAEDVVNALLCVLKYYSNCNTGENIEIPLGTGTAPSIREVVEYCKSECNSNSRLLFGAVPLRWNEPDSVADIKKLNEIGFRPEYQWREGMKLMIERFIK